jgi:S-adenosylmethionine:tRNA ribosyltransferase-isomerase
LKAASAGLDRVPVFDLPAELSATEPPEERGLARDEVRLLVAGEDGVEHASFLDLPRFLQPGDLLVVNTSATLPAAVPGSIDGRRISLHMSTHLDDGTWVVELRRPDGRGPISDAAAGEEVALPSGGRAILVTPVTAGNEGTRLWRARVITDAPVELWLARHGRPISYPYVAGSWPLSAYQTIFAKHPGSAEMPSAARPFSQRLITELITDGVVVAPILLHAGVSSLEAGEPPQPEPFSVSHSTARLVNHAKRSGGRVIAVGTTVTRALESAASLEGGVDPDQGWTNLVLGPDRPARVVDGLITGWHAPEASHLSLLVAVAGAPLVETAYRAALKHHYLWHEFGDSCLLLPPR